MSNHNIDGVLVKLNIRRFQNSKKDKKITEEVVEERALGEEAGSWRKQKFPREALSDIVTLTNKTRSWHYDNTLPWDNGQDLVTNAFLAKYEDGLQAARNELGELVGSLISRYDHWIDRAKVMHNGEFDADDYPSKSELAEKFSISWEILPVPQSGALTNLVDRLGNAKAQEIKQRLDAANDVSKLPAQFLRKGRFDELWMVDIPTEAERREIIQIQLQNHGRPSLFTAKEIESIAKRTPQFTGAEIEAVFNEALYTAFDYDRELTIDDVLQSVANVIPLAVTMKDQVQAMQTWGKGRARPASASIADTAVENIRNIMNS